MDVCLNVRVVGPVVTQGHSAASSRTLRRSHCSRQLSVARRPRMTVDADNVAGTAFLR